MFLTVPHTFEDRGPAFPGQPQHSESAIDLDDWSESADEGENLADSPSNAITSLEEDFSSWN
jgi:hypothetical protein